MSRMRWSAVAAVVALVAAVAVTGAAARTDGSSTIVIGWAFDSKGNMAPFDGPALAAANIRVREINAAGGVNGARLQIVEAA